MSASTFNFQIILGRFLIGLAVGAYCYIIPVYIGELASKEIRGILLTIYQTTLKFGVVFVYILGSVTSLFVLNIVCGSVIIIYTICFIFLPETPIFLIRKMEPAMAEQSIKLLRGRNYDAKQEVAYIQENVKVLGAIKSSFLNEIKKRETFKALLMIVLLFFFFQMSGINAINFYTTTIFIESGITINPSVATVIIGSAQALTTMSTVAFIDRFGRVILLITSFVLMIVGLVGVGSFFYMKNLEVSNFEYMQWLPLPSLCLVCIGFSVGLGPVPITLLGEIFSDDAKKIIAPFAQTMNLVMSFVMGILYPVLVNTIGTGLTFYMFAAFCVIGLLFTIFFVPETKGKSLFDIQELFRK